MRLTREQLIKEVNELREKNVHLEASLKQIEEDIERIVWDRVQTNKAKIDSIVAQIDILIEKLLSELPNKSQMPKDQ